MTLIGVVALGAFLVVLGLVWAGAIAMGTSALGIFGIIVGCVLLIGALVSWGGWRLPDRPRG